jgi:hypothetical protein
MGTIFSKIRNETRVFTLITLIHYSTGIPRQNNKTGEGNERGTEEVKIFLFAGDMIL